MYSQSRQGAVDVIHVEQPIAGESVSQLQGGLAACDERGQPMVVLDLHNVQLIDSKGLELLVDCRNAFLRCGGALKLASLNALCSDILHATGLEPQFEIFDDTRAAIGSFLR